jgi:glycosyltransferase involved in cell wall biosynthesis
MRILTLTNLYPNPFQPHSASFNRQQLRRLADHHDLSIISPILWTEELAARWRGMPALPPGRRLLFDGLPVEYPRYLYTPKVLRDWYGHFFLWSVSAAFTRALAEFQPDLVYAPWAYPDGWAALRLSHRAGLPVVIKVPGSDVLLLPEYQARQRKTAEAIRRADRVVVVSRDLANKVIDLGASPEKVRVVYNGVDAGVFHPGPRAEARRRLGLDLEEPVILFVGNLVPVKGIDVLIDACAHLAARGACFTCHLIGQGPLRPRLQRAIQDRGLGSRVRLHGSLPHERVAEWYRAANVLALPSRSEGVPNVLLEAAACGTPFVASRVGGIPEIAHLGVNRLVPPGDGCVLAEALSGFLRREDSHPGASFPAQSWDQSAGELAAVLEDALRCHRAVRGGKGRGASKDAGGKEEQRLISGYPH